MGQAITDYPLKPLTEHCMLILILISRNYPTRCMCVCGCVCFEDVDGVE